MFRLLRYFSLTSALALLAVTLVLPLFQNISPAAAAIDNAGRLAMAVGIAMTCAILVAGFLGIALPFTFRRLGVDPAIASGPLVTTTNDIVSVSIFMTLALLIAR